MTPLVLHDTAAEIMLWGSVALWFVIECVLRQRAGAEGRDARDWTALLLFLLLPVCVAAGAWAASNHLAPLPGSAWWPVVAGVTLLWLGVALRVWAILTLGRFFQMTVAIQEEHRVIVHGPYRLLRHPSYAGSLTIAAGIGLAQGDWVSIAIVLLGLAVPLLIRIQVEERVLLAELGDDYAAYARRTARLIPGLF